MKESLLALCAFLLLNVTIPVNEMNVDEGIQTIPDEAIRLRILANSDSDDDQNVKRAVRDDVNAYISELVKDIGDIQTARQMIRENLPKIRMIVGDTLTSNNKTVPFTVDYSNNVTFPMKLYDHYLYPAGEYEAVLITLGEGKGANWWCVLFPPLCFLDFSNGTTVEGPEEMEEVDSDEVEVESAVELTDGENETDEDAEQELAMEEFNGEEDEEEEIKILFFIFEWLGLT